MKIETVTCSQCGKAVKVRIRGVHSHEAILAAIKEYGWGYTKGLKPLCVSCGFFLAGKQNG